MSNLLSVSGNLLGMVPFTYMAQLHKWQSLQAIWSSQKHDQAIDKEYGLVVRLLFSFVCLVRASLAGKPYTQFQVTVIVQSTWPCFATRQYGIKESLFSRERGKIIVQGPSIETIQFIHINFVWQRTVFMPFVVVGLEREYHSNHTVLHRESGQFLAKCRLVITCASGPITFCSLVLRMLLIMEGTIVWGKCRSGGDSVGSKAHWYLSLLLPSHTNYGFLFFTRFLCSGMVQIMCS